MADFSTFDISNKLMQINFTVISSVLIFCLTSLTAIVKIWGKQIKPEDKPSDDNQYCQKETMKINQIEKTSEENQRKYESIKTLTNELEKELAVLKNQSENTNKSMEEIKQSNRELANKIDELLKQLMEWISE